MRASFLIATKSTSLPSNSPTYAHRSHACEVPDKWHFQKDSPFHTQNPHTGNCGTKNRSCSIWRDRTAESLPRMLKRGRMYQKAFSNTRIGRDSLVIRFPPLPLKALDHIRERNQVRGIIRKKDKRSFSRVASLIL